SRALKLVRGSYAIGVLFADHPELLVTARMLSPLIIGVHPTGHFVASDIPAILPHTGDFRLVEDGRIVVLNRDSAKSYSLDLEPRESRAHRVEQNCEAAQKLGHPHFMLKEIHEAPEVVSREIAGRLDGTFDELAIL